MTLENATMSELTLVSHDAQRVNMAARGGT